MTMSLLSMDEVSIRRSIRSGALTVAVYGQGYVGLALAAAWLRAGARVIGVDIDERKVEAIRSGQFGVPDAKVVKVLRENLGSRYSITTDGVEASRMSEVKIIAVPIPLERGRPNFKPIEGASEKIGLGLKRGDVVIMESSVPPGTTRRVVKPVLERASGLKVEEDFALAYSPERILVGRALEDIVERYPKIVAGYGERSAKVVKCLYEVVARKGVLLMSSLEAAEFEKLAEGIYRDVNIALANELARLANRMGLDFEEIREAANTQPYSHIHKSGVGVGGPCIPVYPMYLTWLAESYGVELKLVKTSRAVNEEQPAYVASLVHNAIKERGVENPRIVVLGDAFRGDVDDPRNSPTHILVRKLKELGYFRILVHDPYVSSDEELDAPLTNDLDHAISNADVVVVATDHSAYRGLRLSDLASRGVKIVVDGRGVLVGDLCTGPLYLKV